MYKHASLLCRITEVQSKAKKPSTKFTPQTLGYMSTLRIWCMLLGSDNHVFELQALDLNTPILLSRQISLKGQSVLKSQALIHPLKQNKKTSCKKFFISSHCSKWNCFTSLPNRNSNVIKFYLQSPFDKSRQ